MTSETETEVIQPIVSQKPSTHSWIQWLAGSAVVVLLAGILTGCYVETGRYHRPHRVIVIR